MMQDAMEREIKAPTSPLWSEEYPRKTISGTPCKFVRSNIGKVGIAGTTKNAEVFVGRGVPNKAPWEQKALMVFVGETIQQVCHNVDAFNPVSCWSRSLKKQSEND